jgi:hypothetical protein
MVSIISHLEPVIVDLPILQFWTAKVNKLASFGTGFFWDKWTSDLNSEGLKTSKNALFGTFPRVFGRGQFFFDIFSTFF